MGTDLYRPTFKGLPYTSGRWYPFADGGVVGAATFSHLSQIRLGIWQVRSRVVVSHLGIRVTTAAAGNIQIAIYRQRETTGSQVAKAGRVLDATGSIDCSGVGNVNGALAGGNLTLSPGFYWLGINADNTTIRTQTLSLAGRLNEVFSNYCPGDTQQDDIASSATGAGFVMQVAQAFGTWPDITSASQTEQAGQPFFQFKVA